MQNKLFFKAADVCELLEVSTTSAYEIIANLNSELEKKGYLVLKGKVPTKYFVERFYGIEDVCQIPADSHLFRSMGPYYPATLCHGGH